MAVWESTAVQDLFCTCHSKIYQQYHRVCKSLTVLTGASHRSFLYGPHVHILKYMDKTKTEIWENKPLTQRMLLLNPSAVPHLSRLQPPFGSASSQAILLHLKAPDQPEGIPNECFSSWNRKRHWDTTLRYIINLTWENRRKSSCFRWPNGTRSFQQQCTL